MNSIIEILNQSSGQFLQFAWPMLWQSSLLIGFVLALDFLLARKIRASVRYALWLVVLVKLLLPPTLALPTGAAWWLFHAPPVVKAPAIKNYTVTYDTTPLADYVPPTIALPPPPPPQLNGAGWALLATSVISAGLLLWLALRWWQVARMVRDATASEGLADLMEEVRQQAGLRSRLRLKLIEGRMSPAVCGLFRPVILLPRTLAEQLSPAQLRAVLLHEAFHLRRKDVWVNCAQALLQIVYWWHPLLWIANARIRRVREEAVDDAVMLALREEADSYAPTLLEVAKLAFRRPLMSLGLVGIMESRSALRQRIERLVDFRAPRKAGLTLASLCGICVFSAVALPMGEAPATADKSSALNAIALESQPQRALTFMLFHPQDEGVLKGQLMAAGVKIPPTIIHDFNNGIFFARGTVEQLVLIEQTVFKLNGYSPQVVEAATSIPDYAIKIPVDEPATPQFYSRTFKISTDVIYTNLLKPAGAQSNALDSTNASAAFRKLFTELGLNLESPPGKSIFYNEKLGKLFVKATASDLDVIECAVGALIQPSAQNAGGYSPPIDATNIIGITGVSSDPNFNAVIHALEQSGEAKTLAEPEVTTTSGRSINRIAMPNISASSVLQNSNVPQVLIQAEIYRMRQADFEKLVSDPTFTATRQDKVKNFQQFKRLVKSSGFQPISRPRIVTNNGMPAQIYMGNETNSIEFECNPYITNGLIDLASRIKIISTMENVTTTNELNNQAALESGGGHVFSIKSPGDSSESEIVVVSIGVQIVTDKSQFEQRLQGIVKRPSDESGAGAQGKTNKLVYTGPGRQGITNKLDRIRLDNVSFDELPLKVVLRTLAEQSKLRDPAHEGINFLINSSPDKPWPAIDPATGLPVAPTAADNSEPEDIGSFIVKIRSLTDVRLADVLDAIVVTCDHPIKYDIRDFAVVFSAKGPEIPQLFSRTFRLDPKIFYHSLENFNTHILNSIQTNGNPYAIDIGDGFTGGARYVTTVNPASDVSVAARQFFTSLGVNLDAPPGKAVFFNDRLGKLFVKATAEDLDTIGRAISAVMPPAPQIHIKARFYEVPKGTLDGLGEMVVITNQFSQSNQLAGTTGILPGDKFKIVLKNLENQPGGEIMAEPEVVTTSGRQTQMRATIIQTVITNFVFQETSTNSAVVPQLGKIETGPVLDVVPYVLSDGYTINLSLIPSVTEFLGYDTPPTNTVGPVNNAGFHVPVILPKFSVRQAVASVNIWDNQTVVIGGLISSAMQSQKAKVPVIGDLPMVGRLFQSQSKTTVKDDLMIFVTATIVDPAGNRVHSDDDLRFAQKEIPPQPGAK